MIKIRQALQLCNDKTKYNEFNEGLELFDKIIMDLNNMTVIRKKALIELNKIECEIANDKIARLRDTIPLYMETGKTNEMIKNVELLLSILENPQFNSYERLTIATCLYNNNLIEYCYSAFLHIINDISILLQYRIDSARYLIYSEIEENVNIAKKMILGFLELDSYKSIFKYKMIASFLSETGLSTMLNFYNLNVKCDPNWLFELQKVFFWDTRNDYIHRTLSARYMLQRPNNIVDEEYKIKLCDELINIATNAMATIDDITIRNEEQRLTIDDIIADETNNIRANAVDVLLENGVNGKYKNEARKIMRILGYENIRGKKVENLFNKVETLFSNRHNVHDSSIEKSIKDFVTKVTKNYLGEMKTYENVHGEISNVIYKSNLTADQRERAFNGLNRYSIDTATFTDLEISMKDLLIHVWRLINKHSQDEIKELHSRLLNELIDMSGTCSSGHFSRLVNILSGFDFEVKISWEDQLHGNIVGRMEKRIRNIEDTEFRENVILGMDKDSSDLEKDCYLKFIMDNVNDLKKELYYEFVTQKYIKEDEFEKYFKDGMEKLGLIN